MVFVSFIWQLLHCDSDRSFGCYAGGADGCQSIGRGRLRQNVDAAICRLYFRYTAETYFCCPAALPAG